MPLTNVLSSAGVVESQIPPPSDAFTSSAPGAPSATLSLSNLIRASTGLEGRNEINDSVVYIVSEDFRSARDHAQSDVLRPSAELMSSESFTMPSESEESGLSGSEVAAIVVGAIFIVACLALTVFFALRRRDPSHPTSDEPSSGFELDERRSVENPRFAAPQFPAVIVAPAVAPKRKAPPESVGGYALEIDEDVGKEAFKEIESDSIETGSSTSVYEPDEPGDGPRSVSYSSDGEGEGVGALADDAMPQAWQPPEPVPKGSDYDYTSGE